MFKMILFLTLLSAVGCQNLTKKINNRDSSEISSQSSSPSAAPPITKEAHLQTLVILGTNDLHGTLEPLEMKLPAAEEALLPKNHPPITWGGAAVLARYVKILREEFGDNFIWLDAGDQFQGSLESNLNLGKAMVQFLNFNGVQAAAVGNHEFDFGLNPLASRLQEAHYPYLGANIEREATQPLLSLSSATPPQPPAVTVADSAKTLLAAPQDADDKAAKLADRFLSLKKDHLLFQAGALKVGVIGLATLETKVTTRASAVAKLQFTDLAASALTEAQQLRALGAQVVLLTAHSGLHCLPDATFDRPVLRKMSDLQGACDPGDEVVQLLEALPRGTLDAVISGHSHTLVHHWIAGVPVIQGADFGKYLNLIYLNYDWDLHQIITEKTRIEGPIPVCEHVFSGQQDCNPKRKLPAVGGRGNWVSHQFHHRPIFKDPATAELLAPILKKAQAQKNETIGNAVRAIPHFLTRESPLSNLIADAIRATAKSDFGLINSGGIRDALPQGEIRFGDLFRTYPFDNEIVVLKLKTWELRQIIRIAENGSRGFFAVSGLQLKLIDLKETAQMEPFFDLSTPAAWKINRLLDLKGSHGQPLEENRQYTLAMSDFLAQGGDDLGWIVQHIPQERTIRLEDALVRDAILHQIQSLGPLLNAPEQPLIDPQAPRLILASGPQVKSLTPTARRGKKRRSRRNSQQASGLGHGATVAGGDVEADA